MTARVGWLPGFGTNSSPGAAPCASPPWWRPSAPSNARLKGRAASGYWAGHLVAVHEKDDTFDFDCKWMKSVQKGVPFSSVRTMEVKRGQPARYVPVDLTGRK